MGREQMRAADADRQVVADRLRGALDEGRLDLNEYDERLQRTYVAKTYGELDGLLADLPPTVPDARARLAPVGSQGVTPGPDAGPAAPGTNATRRWLAETWSGYFRVVAICVCIWLFSVLVSDDNHAVAFWPIWVIGPWGMVLLVVTAGGLARGEPQRWAGKRDRRQLARAARRQRCGAPAAKTHDD